MGNSDNRKRGVNSRQNEKNREALIAVLTVCLIGVLVTVVIIAAVDLYRKHTYTAEIDPSEYKIIKIEKSTTTSYSAATETVDTDSIYVVTVEYQVDGVTYTDTLDMLTGTELAKNPVWTLSDGFEPGRGAGEALLFAEEAVPYRQIWR